MIKTELYHNINERTVTSHDPPRKMTRIQITYRDRIGKRMKKFPKFIEALEDVYGKDAISWLWAFASSIALRGNDETLSQRMDSGWIDRDIHSTMDNIIRLSKGGRAPMSPSTAAGVLNRRQTADTSKSSSGKSTSASTSTPPSTAPSKSAPSPAKKTPKKPSSKQLSLFPRGIKNTNPPKVSKKQPRDARQLNLFNQPKEPPVTKSTKSAVKMTPAKSAPKTKKSSAAKSTKPTAKITPAKSAPKTKTPVPSGKPTTSKRPKIKAAKTVPAKPK